MEWEGILYMNIRQIRNDIKKHASALEVARISNTPVSGIAYAFLILAKAAKRSKSKFAPDLYNKAFHYCNISAGIIQSPNEASELGRIRSELRSLI